MSYDACYDMTFLNYVSVYIFCQIGNKSPTCCIIVDKIKFLISSMSVYVSTCVVSEYFSSSEETFEQVVSLLSLFHTRRLQFCISFLLSRMLLCCDGLVLSMSIFTVTFI